MRRASAEVKLDCMPILLRVKVKLGSSGWSERATDAVNDRTLLETCAWLYNLRLVALQTTSVVLCVFITTPYFEYLNFLLCQFVMSRGDRHP